MVLGPLAGAIWSLLPASHLRDECAEMVIYYFMIFFSPFPLASSRKACVGLLISQLLPSRETHLSSSPKSVGSSLPWEAGRVFPRLPGGPCPRSRVFPCSQVSDGSLTVLSVSREDRGAYTCRAYSIQGEAVHTTRLLVQGETFQLLSIPWQARMGESTRAAGLWGHPGVTPKASVPGVVLVAPWLCIRFVGWRNPLNWGTVVAVLMSSQALMAARFCLGSGEKIEAVMKRLVRQR